MTTAPRTASKGSSTIHPLLKKIGVSCDEWSSLSGSSGRTNGSIVEFNKRCSKDIMEEGGYIEEDNVRIYPSKMIFLDAFDGKVFRKKLRIINAGRYPAFIRVLPPTSKVGIFA